MYIRTYYSTTLYASNGKEGQEAVNSAQEQPLYSVSDLCK